MSVSKIDQKTIKKVTVNLNKVAILLAVIGILTFVLGWFRYSGGDVIYEIVWSMRIASIVILYLAVKCYFIGRYLRKASESSND